MYRAYNRPALRDGCWPTPERHQAPLNYRKMRDGLNVRIVHPDEITGPLTLTSSINPHETEPYESGEIFMVRTGAGQFLFTQKYAVVYSLLTLASIGHHAVIRWMQGMTTNDAMEAARAEYKESQKPRQPKPPPSLDDLDIQI